MSDHQTKFDNLISAIEQLKNGILLFSNENDLLTVN